MDLKVAYNKVDNLCCHNHNVVTTTNMDIDKGIVPKKIDFFEGYSETHDEDFCRDAYEMMDALETIKEVVDLQDDLGCPLAIVGRLLLHKERYMYTIEKSKLTGEDFMDKHKIVGVSEFGVCILTTNYLLKTEPKYYEWNKYGKTWWLKEDQSE